MKKILSIFLLCLCSVTVFSENMSSRSVGNSAKYPANVVTTALSIAQGKGFTDVAQQTAATAKGYTDDQAGATAYQAQLADTANAANCVGAYSKACSALTKAEYTIVKALQSQTLTVASSPSSLTVGTQATLSTSGNQAAVTYTAMGACTVSGSTVTAAASAGTCTITANAPYTAGYKAASPTAFSIAVGGAQPQPLTVAAASTVIYTGGSTTTVTTTGNLTGGSVTYAASGACTVSGSTVTPGASAGSCTITATTVSNVSYTSGIGSVVITVNPRLAQVITLSAASASIVAGGTTLLTSAGNQATVTYTASGACTVSGSTVTAAASAGACTITGNASATGNYAAGTGTVAITVTDPPPTRCFVIDFTNNNYNPTCGAGNRLATFTEMKTSLCQVVAFRWNGSSSVYLQGSDGRYIRNGVGYGTNWTIATFSAGAATGSSGKSGNSFALGSTEAAVCVAP